jgi:hypothetical protein
MSDFRSGRVNALVCAILDAHGDSVKLAEQMRFFTDLTQDDIDRALALSHWARTPGAASNISQTHKPLGLAVRENETA